jgi:hypothetical protein
MKRFNLKHDDERRNRRVDAFIEAVLAVCKQHGLSISHEDCHGAFIVVDYAEEFDKWLRDAQDGTDSQP